MTGRDHEPLTPEERDLARRLARVDGSAEPSPALDARILAAARASENAAPSPVVREMPVRRRPRFAWAAGLGVAASLVLAVGIAWQLRPQPDADVQYSEAPAAAKAMRDEEPLAEVRAPEAFPASPMPPPPPPPQQQKSVSSKPAASAPAQETRARRQFSPPPQESKEKQAEAAESGHAEAPVVFDEPSPVDTPAPPAPPAPASAPAPRAAEAASEPPPDLSALSSIDAAGAVQETANDERERKARAKEASLDAAKQRRAESLDRIETTSTHTHEEIDEDAGFADQPYDDEPPASADSPEVRTAWLARIRELLGEGKTDAARASLAEFHRRYPDAPLPDDLRPLLQ